MSHRLWLERWQQGQIGWHEPTGNLNLKSYWGSLESGRRVLVPLCGKSTDLVWLLSQGHDVTGVELSTIGVKAFFTENRMEYLVKSIGKLDCYQARDLPLRIFCGDYLAFEERGFDALYDRAALVALSPDLRPEYAAHTAALLAPGAELLIITLEYDQARVDGPPFCVGASEVLDYWPGLERVAENNVINSCSPRFAEANIDQANEVVWLGRWPSGRSALPGKAPADIEQE